MPDLRSLLDERSSIDQQVLGYRGRTLQASEQRKYDRLLETRSALGAQIAAASGEAPLAGRVLQTVQSNFAARTAKVDELRSIDEAAAGRNYTPTEKAQVTELRSAVDEIDNRISGMLGQAVSGQEMREATDRLLGPNFGDTTGPGDGARQAGIGGFEARSEDVQRLFDEVRDGRHVGRLEYRAVTAYPTTITQDVVGHVPIRREPTRLAAYMPVQQVTVGATATYWMGSAAASAVTSVAAGGQKPESTPGWTQVTATIRKLAHWTEVPREALEDYPSFEQIVREEMTGGLINFENAQIASGGGTGTDLTGLTAAAGIQSYAPGSAEARVLSILHGITMLRTGTAFLEADTIVLNPADWEKVQNYSTTQGELIAGNVSAGTALSLWGVRVVLTTGLAAGTGLVANLAASTVVFQREAPIVLVDPYSASTKNLVRFISEERLALGVIRPTGIVKITFNGSN